MVFHFLKQDLENNNIIKESFLSEQMTYSVVSSTDAYFNLYQKKKEILGISWKNTNYRSIDKSLLKEITKNNIPVYDGDVLAVTTQAVLMVLLDVKDEYYDVYVNERINAIEIFWRQKFLLKRMHFELDCLINDVKRKKKKEGLKSTMEYIQDIQISIQSELEIYRNTIISATHSYSMLFETLNKVFQLNKHYKFVQEKLKTCKSIYEGLNDEEYNRLMERIQWTIIIIGIATVLLTFLVDVVYGPTIGPNQQINISIILIIFILIFMIFLKIKDPHLF